MNNRIIESLTGLADVFGWKLPKWALRNIPESELQALRQEEESLTEALRRGNPRTPEMPAFLEARIERALEEAERPEESFSWRSYLALPATAMAAILLVGIFLSDTAQKPPPSDEPGFKLERAVASDSNQSPNVGNSLELMVDRFTDLKKGAQAEGLLVQPLAEEPVRLASDVTHALRIVAQSVLPESYLERVNRNLDQLEEGVSKAI